MERARPLMLANREHPEQSTTGSLRRGEDHWVAGRRGKPCRRCGTAILLGEQGPDTQERVTRHRGRDARRDESVPGALATG